MKIVNRDKITLVKGISVRTTNAAEMKPETAKIGGLHQRFDQNVSVDYKNGARVYGVYFDYESDATGEFSVLAGADQIESAKVDLEEIKLPAGKYLVFEGRGEMPQAVIQAWGEVWNYFSDQDSAEKRSYTVDFEHYTNADEVDIYIAIK